MGLGQPPAGAGPEKLTTGLSRSTKQRVGGAGWGGAAPSGALPFLVPSLGQILPPARVLGPERTTSNAVLSVSLSPPPTQIPRYILTLHELLAHTPHEHVERNSLDYAKSKLEELSR